MALSKELKDQYIKTLEQTRDRIKNVEAEMEKELEETRGRLRELLEEKKSMRKVYDGLASLLGVENEFEGQDEEEKKIQEPDLENL